LTRRFSCDASRDSEREGMAVFVCVVNVVVVVCRLGGGGVAGRMRHFGGLVVAAVWWCIAGCSIDVRGFVLLHVF